MRDEHTATIDGYAVTVYPESDPGDPERGEYVECWVTSRGGGHTNSLALLEDLGEFDDGPKIGAAALRAIRRFAEKHGYE